MPFFAKPMPFQRVSFCLLITLTCLFQGSAGAEDTAPAPYGHRDFYPSPERPIGFRGDGNGHFPGATPVLQWWEGKPVREPDKTVKGRKQSGFWEYADREQRNIVWKTPLPGWSLAQPIVVGDRVICIMHPDVVAAYDAHSGRELWQQQLPALTLDGVDAAEGSRRQRLLDLAMATFYLTTLCQRLEGEELEARRALLQQAWQPLLTQWRRHARDAALLEAVEMITPALRGYGSPIEPGESRPTKPRQATKALSTRLAELYSVPSSLMWSGEFGFAVSTPVSDGRYIWVVFGQGQIACYDLDGKRQWATRLREYTGDEHIRIMAGHLPSPILCQGMLLVRSLMGESLHGFDSHRGEHKWTRKLAPMRKRGIVSHGSFAGHKIVRVGDEGRPVIVTNQGAILDPTTGTVLARWHYDLQQRKDEPPRGHGSSIVGRNGLFFYADGQRGNLSMLCARYVIELQGPQQVLKPAGYCETLPRNRRWKRGIWGYQPIVLTESGILSEGTVALSARNGKIIGQCPDLRSNTATTSATFAGDHAIVGQRSQRHIPTEPLRSDGLALMAFHVVDFTQPRQPRLVARANLLGNARIPKDRIVDTLLTTIPKSLMVGLYRALPPHFGCRNGGVMPMANRLFIQSNSHLYAIGDSKAPYDWNPASRQPPP